MTAVSWDTAVSRLLECRRSLLDAVSTTTVSLDAVAGRTASESVHAPADVPARDFATMDGFALATADQYPLSVVGDVGPADDPPEIGAGEAVRIATGAPLPARADAVLPVEDATVTTEGLHGDQVEAGHNLYPAGATAEAGEQLFDASDRLAARHAALLRDVGIDEVAVHSRLSVGILATGTEIHEGRQPDRDSEMLANLVREWGHEPTILGSVPDDEAAVRRAIAEATADHDAVVTSGGSSVGRGDHVGAVLAAHDLLFDSVALRPGRPVTAALVDGTLVCGLPGKPVAAHTAATLVVAPAFCGERRRATVSATPTSAVAMPDQPVTYAVPVALDGDRAVPVGHPDSGFDLYRTRFRPGRVASSTRVTLADGVVLTTDALDPETPVEVLPYEVLA